jgi:hypothetical protein
MAEITSLLELHSLAKLKTFLDKHFGAEPWTNFEPETILLDLGVEESSLLVDKLSILRILGNAPELMYQDPILFLYTAEVTNNIHADFDSIPHITMLEAAYAIHSIDQYLRVSKLTPVYTEALIKTCSYILRNEGCSEVIEPFTFVPLTELVKGQTESDTADKNKAIKMYTIYMDSL